jgi:cytochrome c peroxidase
VIPGVPIDVGTAFADATFHRGATSIVTNVRRVEPRNTPTVDNAVFNYSNFWDGRAHNLFNGVSVIGPLDPSAKIWVNRSGTGSAPVQETVRFPNSSLASQAVGPLTSDLEMSFFNRPFPMVGRKLLNLTPLGLQLVDQMDSVLGPLSRFPNPGLNTSYSALISAAFAGKYWNGANVTVGSQTFTHMEANFTLFWGLAVQRYEQQLVSDRSPFDLFMEGSNTALTPAQLKGLLVFINQGPGRNTPQVNAAIAALGVPIGAGNCVSCHGGPEFTEAAFTSLAGELIEQEDTPALVAGLLQATARQGLLDKGFSNIGVRPNNDDPGRGGMEGGFPLSFVPQAVNPALNFLLKDLGGAADLLPCTVVHNCPSRLQVNGAFKIPGLRNAELTGPYFHNGGQATLTQVLEFYDRQGDFADVNIANVDQNLAFVNISDDDEPSLLAFLQSLTDERVRQEKAPFDHPEIFVSRGGTVLEVLTVPPIVVPRVGAGGRPAAGLPPLGTFLGLEP